tara:strand:- start:1637 stop:2890 length:1254 start_codon:yes stop_codon:yes gene_type:complete
MTIIKLNKNLLLPILTLSITLANFIFIINVTNFFGVNNDLDINFLIYGVILFFAGQLGTLLSNSYIPFIRKSNVAFEDELYQNSFFYGLIFFIFILSLILFLIFALAIPSSIFLIIFYCLFLIVLSTNQLIALRIIESQDKYILVQIINVFVSLISIIAFYFLNSFGIFSISLSLLTAHLIGSFFFFYHDNYNFDYKRIYVLKNLYIFLDFLITHYKVILCLSIFALASVMDVFFIKYLDDGDFSMHALSFRIIVAATSVYYASFGIMFTNDISKKGIKDDVIKEIVKNTIATITLVAISFNLIFYFMNDYQIIWNYIFDISQSSIEYFSQSLLFNSCLILPMLALSYYFRFQISRNNINPLLSVLCLWVFIYSLSVIICIQYDIGFVLQMSLNIAWWSCLIFITLRESKSKYLQAS